MPQTKTQLEKYIEQSFSKIFEKELDSVDCHLVYKAVSYLRFFDDWLEDEKLIEHRIGYFFHPILSKRDKIVFLTQPLFLRDILESEKIDGKLYNPITFVTPPLAYFLFRDYSVHINVNYDKFKSKNKCKEIGNLIICEGDAVLCRDMIENITGLGTFGITKDYGLDKIAVSNISRGIFKNDEDEKKLNADMKVWNKKNRCVGRIINIIPGENGQVDVEENGKVNSVPKMQFDETYTVVEIKSASTKYDININGKRYNLSVEEIGNFVKEQIRKSNVLMRTLNNCGLSEKDLDELRIEIEKNEDNYAQTNNEFMKLNPVLFDDVMGKFFIVAHEFWHFCAMKSGRTTGDHDGDYFADKEEGEGFVLSIAYELEQGRDLVEIKEKVFPKIKFHFSNEEKANQFFDKLVEKAASLV